MARIFDQAQAKLRKAQESLQRAPEMLAQQLSMRADIAVTGLRRAGKTVFITSCIHNLLSARQAKDALPALKAQRERRLIAVNEVAASTIDVPLFPTRTYLRALAGEEPRWPEPTAAVSKTELEIRYERGSITKHLPGMAEGTLRLGLIDYPGEWLLDIPMLGKSFAEWSQATLELLSSEPRVAVANDFLEFSTGLDLRQPAESAGELVWTGHALYRKTLLRARDELHLSFLQPGRFVMPDDKGDRPSLWFFPVRVEGTEPAGSLGAVLTERYSTYCQRIVKPFFDETFDRANRQVVLVDLLAALNAGRFAFEDSCLALETALEALQVRRSGLIARLFPRRFERVLFAATKSDHVPGIHRDRLGDLLARITGIEANRASGAGASAKTIQMASMRCTIDDKVRLDIGEVEVVVGTPVGRDSRSMLHPGTIPVDLPPAKFWADRDVKFPVFKPPPISALPGAGIPHINLDVALEFLIGDLLG
jgi:predicted YcjX-like family ATPase